MILAPVVAVIPKSSRLPPWLPPQFRTRIGEPDANQAALPDRDDLDLEVGYSAGSRGRGVCLDGADVVGVRSGTRVGDGELVL